MKHTLKETTGAATAEQVIELAKIEAANAVHAMRLGCGHALKSGLALIWLHRDTASQGTRNDLVPRGTKLGFEEAVERVGLPKRTAYRWMNAAGAAAFRANLARDGEELVEELPEPGTPRWEMWTEALEQVAEGMSLNRLILGHARPSTAEHRLDTLAHAEEGGSPTAAELLEKVADGHMTLEQAVKALGGAEATKGKTRRDPCYLDLDPKNGELRGLMPASLKTLRNAFGHWAELPEPARKKVRELWLDVIAELPRELIER